MLLGLLPIKKGANLEYKLVAPFFFEGYPREKGIPICILYNPKKRTVFIIYQHYTSGSHTISYFPFLLKSHTSKNTHLLLKY